MALSTKKFQRKKENFICFFCKKKVVGNGYTNHCPYCLWSRHVDIYPGDRAEPCKGMMEPVGVDIKRGSYRVIHRCQECGQKKINKMQLKDNLKKIISMSLY